MDKKSNMRKFIVFILLTSLYPMHLFAKQSVQALVKELEWDPADEGPDQRIAIAYKILILDPVNHEAITFICDNYAIDNRNAIQPFLDKIIAAYPKNKDLYLIKADYFKYGKADWSDKELAETSLFYLHKAYQLDSTDLLINYKLAELYYRDFIAPYDEKRFIIGFSTNLESGSKTRKKRSFIPHSGKKALHYFLNAMRYGTDSARHNLYFPVQQLRYALYHQLPEKLNYPPSLHQKYDYFIWDYSNLNKGWYKDLTMNYLILIEWIARDSYNQTSFMRSIGEPPISRSHMKGEDQIIRFRWCRSFRSDVFVKLEKRGDRSLLAWKEFGWSSSKKKDSIRTGQRVIASKEFKNIIRWFNRPEFEKYNGYSYMPICDGDNIFFERVSSNGFQVYYSNTPPDDFRKVCYLLVSMTDISLEEEFKNNGFREEVKNMRNGTAEQKIKLYAVIGFGVVVIVVIFLFIASKYRFWRKKNRTIRPNRFSKSIRSSR